MSALNAAEVQLTPALIGVAQAIATDAASVSSLLVSENAKYLSGLSAYANRIELAELSQSKAREALADSEVQSLVNTYKEVEISRIVTNTNLDYGDAARPISGDIGVAGSCHAVVAKEERAIILSELGSNFDLFGDSRGPVDRNFSDTQLSNKDEDEFSSASLIRNKTFTSVKSKNIQELVSLIANSNPESAGDELLVNDDELLLNNKIYQTKLKLLHAVISIASLDNEPLIEQSVVPAYLDPSTTSGKLGATDSLLSSVNGRLSSDGWYLGVKQMATSGLLRESIYLRGEENVMLNRILKYKDLNNTILALSAITSAL